MVLRILFVSNLFPNSVDPTRGLFSINQLRALRELGCDFRVVAPVATFPFVKSRWVEEARRLREHETFDGFEVLHPKAWYVPRSRRAENSHLYHWSVRGTVERLCDEYRPALLWGSFAFPDGVAVGNIARGLGLPYVVSLLGSDINLNLTKEGRRRVIVGALEQASLVLAKSLALKEIVVGLGVAPDRVLLDYNGVDQDVFSPRPREEACGELGIDPSKRRVLYVGNFVEVKNLPTLVRAFARLSQNDDGTDCDLVMVGGGRLREDLLRLIRSLRLGDRVHMVRSQPHEKIATWMSACDVLCLPSLNEGVPNVVLEAFSCGVPVVASAVGGIPEVHPGGAMGSLFDPRDIDALAAALREALDKTWDRRAIVDHARPFTWKRNAETVLAALEKVAATSGS
jgi:teichuronic acid biosynthesis glycosyltransferase TuaC